MSQQSEISMNKDRSSVPAMDSLQSNLNHCQNLKSQLKEFSQQPKNEVPIRIPLTDVAFLPGKIANPNEVLVHLGADYFVRQTSEEAQMILDRKIEAAQQQLNRLEAITGLKSSNGQEERHQQQGQALPTKSPEPCMEASKTELNSKLEAFKIKCDVLESDKTTLKAEIRTLKSHKDELSSKLQHSIAASMQVKGLEAENSELRKKLQEAKAGQSEAKAALQLYRTELTATHDRLQELEEANSQLQKQLKDALSSCNLPNPSSTQISTYSSSDKPHKRPSEGPEAVLQEEGTKSSPKNLRTVQWERAERDSDQQEEEEETYAESGLPFMEIEEYYDEFGNEVSAKAINLGQQFKETKDEIRNLKGRTAEKGSFSTSRKVSEELSPQELTTGSSANNSLERSHSQDMDLLDKLMAKEIEAKEDDSIVKKRGLVSKEWKSGFLNKPQKGKTAKQRPKPDPPGGTHRPQPQKADSSLKESLDFKDLEPSKSVRFGPSLVEKEKVTGITRSDVKEGGVKLTEAFPGTVVERPPEASVGAAVLGSNSNVIPKQETYSQPKICQELKPKVSRFKARRQATKSNSFK